MTEAHRFQNALRIIRSLDRHELVAAGVISGESMSAWVAFRDHPHECALRLREDRMEKLFTLIESRQPKREMA